MSYDRPEIVPLLFQTGYLTIKSMDTVDDLRLYRLGFPNGEVRAAFNRSLVSAYTNVDEFRKTSAQVACIRALQAHDLEAFPEPPAASSRSHSGSRDR